MSTVTIFKNIYPCQPYYISVDKALDRIKTGKSRAQIEKIRQADSKETADALKEKLPSVCFSGKFPKERTDDSRTEHSGFLVLDFDDVGDTGKKKIEIICYDFVYACWISPRDNGIKTLVKIADGNKHREHFSALKEVFPDADKSGVNPSRVCYESDDPNIYINKDAKVFTGLKEEERVDAKVGSVIAVDEKESFTRILNWLTNRGDAFVTGERSVFIYKLAAACCRFGIDQDSCKTLCAEEFPIGTNSFSYHDCKKAIEAAYKKNKNRFGDAILTNNTLVDKASKKEVEIDKAFYDPSVRPKDVIYGSDVKNEALGIYDNGYRDIEGVGIPDIDKIFKFRRGDLTGLSGLGNAGKSSMWEFMLLMRIILYGNKFALFSPEKSSAQAFYHDLVEIILGTDCTPKNQYYRPHRKAYEKAYDYISKHIFYVYPKELSPTPEYIKERFLELIIKEKVDGCIIDPFNQLTNDYSKSYGRSDKYLETFLSDCERFAKLNNVFFTIILHPHAMRKGEDGNYPCPDIFDLNDGAMWNNKLTNLLIYHRPNHQKDPMSPVCELHSKKIKDQKIVGIKGVATFEWVRHKRRFFFDNRDYLQEALDAKKIDFEDEIIV